MQETCKDRSLQSPESFFLWLYASIMSGIALFMVFKGSDLFFFFVIYPYILGGKREFSVMAKALLLHKLSLFSCSL